MHYYTENISGKLGDGIKVSILRHVVAIKGWIDPITQEV